MRDLLGISPDVAADWTAEQRASARHVLDDGLRSNESLRAPASEDIPRALADVDADRFAHGAGALGLVHVSHGEIASVPAAGAGDVMAGEQVAFAPVGEMSDAWSATLAARGEPIASALATDAGHTGRIVVTPAPRLAVAAALVEPDKLLVNPVVLAALEPNEVTVDAVRAPESSVHRAVEPPEIRPNGNGAGNPYSFYGSFEECAAAQQSRCDACVAAGSCTSITNSDGVTECQQLAANNGRGYFLICINLALAIDAVNRCAKDQAASCPQNDTATTSLSDLEANADFLDMPACATGLDTCLGQIYGAPPQPFPSADGGVATEPPRQTAVSCTNSCDSPNTQVNPNCDCSGPSCNNSLSCDGACNSNSSGCDSCTSDGGGGGGGGGNSGCSCDNSSGGGSGGGGCSGGGGGGGGGCDNGCGSSSGGNSCSGGDCGGSSGGGGCGGSSGGGGCGGSSGGGSCGGGGGSSNCQVARTDGNTGWMTLLSVAWALLPVGVASRVRRRARKGVKS